MSMDRDGGLPTWTELLRRKQGEEFKPPPSWSEEVVAVVEDQMQGVCGGCRVTVVPQEPPVLTGDRNAYKHRSTRECPRD